MRSVTRDVLVEAQRAGARQLPLDFFASRSIVDPCMALLIGGNLVEYITPELCSRHFSLITVSTTLFQLPRRRGTGVELEIESETGASTCICFVLLPSSLSLSRSRRTEGRDSERQTERECRIPQVFHSNDVIRQHFARENRRAESKNTFLPSQFGEFLPSKISAKISVLALC